MSLLWLIQLHEIDYGSCQQNRFIYRKRSCLILDGQFLYKTLKTAGKSVNERPRSFGDLLQVLTRRHCLAYSIVLIILWAYVREPEGRAVVEPGVQWQNQNKHKQHKYGHVQQTTVPDYCKVNSLVVSITTPLRKSSMENVFKKSMEFPYVFAHMESCGLDTMVFPWKHTLLLPWDIHGVSMVFP